MSLCMAESFVAGVLSDRQAVEEVYKRLRAIGIHGSDISILLPASTQEREHESEANRRMALKACATLGILLGGLVGGLLGFEALVIPAVAVIDEPILSVLIWAAAGGTLGGAAGWLVSVGTSKRAAIPRDADKAE